MTSTATQLNNEGIIYSQLWAACRPSDKAPTQGEMQTESGYHHQDQRRYTSVQTGELTLTFLATFCDLLSSGEQPKPTQGFPALDIIGKSIIPLLGEVTRTGGQ